LRFAQKAPVDGHDGIGADHPCVRVSIGNFVGLGFGQTLNESSWLGASKGAFVTGTGNDIEAQTGLLEQIAPPRGPGSQNKPGLPGSLRHGAPLAEGGCFDKVRKAGLPADLIDAKLIF
jgi:hypothetical protein